LCGFAGCGDGGERSEPYKVLLPKYIFTIYTS
jgi:hypothetical protein